MVTTATLPDEVRQDLADQIGRLLPQEQAFVGESLTLGESMPVRVLSANAVQTIDGSLREGTEALNEWHHQILTQEGVATFTATSVSIDGGEAQSVVEVAQPEFASLISRAVTRLDEEYGDQDGVAELLMAPAYYLVAILITGADERVLIVDRPERLSTLEIGYLYPAAAFLEALRRYPPSSGVPVRG